ncbi:MAG: hypothetical protein GY679_03935 [Mycoplasma sp.]|nr:hypothetical protein [Mycoplasma sp.]
MSEKIKYKILVDSTLCINKDWFESIPSFIEGKPDTNNPNIDIKGKKTAYLSFDGVLETMNVNPKDKTIIFTNPTSVSSQFNSYNQLNDNNNILILEGTTFIVAPEKIKDILEQDLSFKELKDKVDKLNKSIKFVGFIVDVSELAPNGRINSAFKYLIKTTNIKIRLKWSEGKWNKDKISLNIMKLIKDSLTDNITFICLDKDYPPVKKIIEKIYKFNPDIKINFQKMTNGMGSHSGRGFITIYQNK